VSATMSMFHNSGGRAGKGRGLMDKMMHTSCQSNLFVQSQLGYQVFDIPRTVPSEAFRTIGTGRSIHTAG